MNRSTSYFVAAALACGGVSLAFANTSTDSSMAPKVSSMGSKGDYTGAQEAKSTKPVPQVPVAKAEKTTGADGRLASNVVNALNGDSSLKGSKIDVMASNGDITLSGTTKDASQIQKAGKDAGARSKGNVTNELKAG